MKNRTFTEQLLQKLFFFGLLISICASALPTAAQTRRNIKKTVLKPTVSKVSDKKESKCNSGWSGTISYSRTLDESDSSDEPGIRKGKDRIIQQWSHNVSYKGQMTIDGSVNPQSPEAFGNVEFGDFRKQHGIEKIWDSCHAFNDEHWFIIDGNREDVETGSGSGSAESFNLSVDEFAGTYNFSFKFPDVPGKSSIEDHTKRSGHCQPKNNEPIDLSQKSEMKITGEGEIIENQKIDPKNPNVLSGKMTIDRNDNDPKSVKTPITVISWKFKRCASPLMITDLKFYQPTYPSPNSFVEIGKDDHAIDGNQVKILATIVNLSGEQKTANVQFKDLTDNTILPDGAKSEIFAPHEEKEVEMIWDTNGFAWKQDSPYNTAVNSRDIEVSIPDDKMSEQISVYPKPVIIVPGMWSKREKIENFVKYFQNQNVPWTAIIVRTYVSKKSADNVPIIDKTVREVQKQANAWHVDLVAHSTGGLAARAYINSEMPIQFDGLPTAKNLIMLGTPNLGTPCAAGVDNIITKFFNRNPEVFSEISHKNMVSFNNIVTDAKGTNFLAVASDSISPICQLEETGDGVVPFISAVYKSKTYVTTNIAHEDLGGDQTVFTQIKKWLALAPKESRIAENSTPSNFNLKTKNLDDLALENFGKLRNYGAMFHGSNLIETNSGDDDPEPDFAIGIKLAANASTEIEIPVTSGSRLSLILYASPNISATLLDDKGEIVGKNLAGTTEANAAFRIISVKKPFQNGKWKLKLESRVSEEAEVAVTVFINYGSKIFSGK